MRRLVWLVALVGLGATLVGFSLLVPAHLRAVDATVLDQAVPKARTPVEEGLKLVGEDKLGAAQLFLECAQAVKSPGQESLGVAIRRYHLLHPNLQVWGTADAFLQTLFGKDPAVPHTNSVAILDFLLRREARERVFEFLTALRRPEVAELLQVRKLSKTVYFPPATSSAGQTLDAVVALSGLLVQGHHLMPSLQDQLLNLVPRAIQGSDSQPLEQAFMDLLTLGRRLNWGQLSVFLARVEDLQTLHQLALVLRANEAQLPLLFTCVELSGRPAAVANYLMDFKDTGLADLGFGLRAGGAGLDELLRRGQRVYYPGLRSWVVDYDPFGSFFDASVTWCWRTPRLALVLKYLCFLAGGFLLARSYLYWRPAIPALEQPLQVPALAPARQGVWAVFFLLVLIFLSEPFLAQESQRVEFPLKLQLPRVGSVAPAGLKKTTNPLMNQLSIASLVLFFVLQGLIYTACLIKLAEIRRQTVGPRLKLRLLENEEHLFDAGLYLGFVGTIISLILMSMGVVKPSLMAGYSSTSFGIIFVSVLKIFHVRPLRRRLILESESAPA